MIRSWYMFAVLLVLSACNGKDISDKRPLSALEIQCKPDKALLALETACQIDENCPCGSHCELGVCTVSCTRDSECELGGCDAFGRCTLNPGQIPEVDPAPAAIVKVWPEVVTLDEQRSAVLFLDAEGYESGPVRVAVNEPLEVTCDGVSYSSFCVVDNLLPDIAGPMSVDIRQKEGTEDASGAANVSVSWGAGSETRAVTVDPPPSIALGGADIACTNLESGIYEGTARLIAIGSNTSPSSARALPESLAEIHIPVRAQIYSAGAGVVQRVQIDDEYGAIFGQDGAIGDISDASALDLPATAYFHAANFPGTAFFPIIGQEDSIAKPIEIDLGVGFSTADFSCGPRYLAINLDVAFLGLTAEAPFLRWELQMGRSDEVAVRSSPPAIPAAWEPALPLDFEFAPPPAGTVFGGSAFIKGFEAQTFAACAPGGAAVADPRVHCACADGIGPQPTTLSYDNSAAPGRSGDLKCRTDGVLEEQRIFGLFTRNQIVDSDVDDCLADLRDGIAGTSLGPKTCVDAGRARFFLDGDLAVNRKEALAPPAGAQDSFHNQLVLRNLQEWLSVAAFVAHDAVEIDRRDRRIVDPNDPTFGITPASYTLLEALQTSVDATTLILHPLVAPGLEGMLAADVASPDYRPLGAPGLVIDDARTHDQSLGLPVSILRADTSQLLALRALAQSAIERRSSIASVTPLFDHAVRSILPAIALANVGYQHALSLGEPEWQPEWDNAEILLATALSDALASFDSAKRGDNEFGIAAGELPLARIGDEEGVFNKFSALSDFLLGAPGSQLAVAPAMVERAANKLVAAREAWIQLQERDLDQEFSSLSQERREIDIANEYGEQIVGLCGNPEFETTNILDDEGLASINSCFIKDACLPTFEEKRSKLTAGDLGYGMCIHGFMRNAAGAAADTSGDAEYDRLADLMPDNKPRLEILSVSPDDDNDLLIDVRWAGTDIGGTIAPAKQRNPIAAPFSVPFYWQKFEVAEEYKAADSACRVVWLKGEAARPYQPHCNAYSCWNEVRECEIAQDCAPGRECQARAGICDRFHGESHQKYWQTRSITETCFQGTIGQSALAVNAAKAEVAAAAERLSDKTVAFDIRVGVCDLIKQATDRKEARRSAHASRMRKLNAAKREAEETEDILDTITGVLSIDFVDALNPFKKASKLAKLGKGALLLGIGAMAGASAAASLSANEVEEQIANEQVSFQNDIDSITDELEVKRCYAEAQLELVGSQEAANELSQAVTLFNAAVAQHLDDRNLLSRLIEEGRETLEAERALKLPTLATDFWVDEKINDYETALRQAKRTVFLAVLASEYEFQMSTPEGDNALAANTTAELAQVVERLRGLTATGSIGGATPTDLVEVVSLRDHVLQVGNSKKADKGLYDLSEAERFRLLLSSEAYAVYNYEGTYLGQELPFNLLPSEKSGLANTQDIAILSGQDCAERVWSVNASLIGSNLHTSDTSKSRITLHKSDSFFSQWCGLTGPDGSDYQFASTTKRNLFFEPESFVQTDLPQTFVPTDPSATFTSARLQPRFNVSREQLESESYVDGDSQELAGRGLYGQYSIFIPAETIATQGRDGLNLSQVEDILLRFDYVSVAR